MSSAAPSPTTKYSPAGAAALLLFLLFLNILNFVDRQLIPSLAPKLMESLGLSREQIGLLYGYLFVTFYTAMGMVLGVAADRWNRPRLIAAGLFLWSALTAASGAATGFLGLALARMLVGVGEATLTPASLSLLGDAFPEKRRAWASGVYYAGVPLGSGLGLIISGWLAPQIGWQGCFYVLGGIGVLVVPLVLLIPDRRDRPAQARQASNVLSTREIAKTLFAILGKSPALWWLIAGATLANYAAASSSLVLTWMTTERMVPFSTAAYWNGTVYAIAGLLGTSGGGLIADWCHRRWSGGRLWFLVVKSLLLYPAILGFYFLTPGTPFHFFCWFFSSWSATSWYGPVFASVQELAPARIRSTAIAFLLLCINFIGVGLGPWITGRIGDRWSLHAGLLISTVIGLAAIVPFYMAARRYAKDLAKV